MRKGMTTMDIAHPHRETEQLIRKLKVQEINFYQFVEWMVRLDCQENKN